MFAAPERRCQKLPLSQRGGIDEASNDAALDSTVVLAAQNFEGASVAPVFVPRVGNEPVLGTSFHTPAHDLDRVTTELRALHVLVNSGLVGQEV